MAKRNKLAKRNRPLQIRKPQKFLQYLKQTGGMVTQAIDLFLQANPKSKMTMPEHSHWVTKDPTYAAAVQAIKEGTIDLAESSLITLIKAGNLNAITYYLNYQAKRRGYNSTIDVNVTGNISHKVTVVDFSDRPE
jgi:hypothetical protein